jgi:type IV pilus assembly protein PilX
MSNLQARQRGMALVSGLLLLLVVTIIGLSMFRSFGLQARIAGNTREKQRALHAAEGAQAFAEWWLSAPGGGNATVGSTCNALVTVESGKTQVCSNTLTNVTTVPWKIGNADVGVQFTPVGLNMTGTDSYYQPPRFYIAYMNGSYNKQTGTLTKSYRVDAAGFGGNSNTASVVESAYRVSVTYTTLNQKLKFVSLTGP